MKLKPNPETKYAAELRKTVGHAFCVAAALLFVSTLANSAQPTPEATMTYAELKNGFENPPLNTRPMVRWWWPGGDVTDEEISRELRLMKEAGIGGVEIQSFKIGLNPNPAPDVAARVDSFLSPQWFGHVKHAIEEGERLGMIVDLTFGSGWPFGGPHIPPALSAQGLSMLVTTVEGPSNFNGKIPWVAQEATPKVPPGLENIFAAPLRDPKSFKLVAVMAVRGTQPEIRREPSSDPGMPPLATVTRAGQIDPGSVTVLTGKVKPDRTLDWTVPDGHWLLFSFIQGPTGQQVVGGAGKGTQFVLDHMRAAALERHIDAIGEAGKKYFGDEFGHGLRAIFCDSLEVTADGVYWNDDFLAEFQKRRGYDLTPYLPVVKRPGYGDPYVGYSSEPLYDAAEIADRVRHDYWQTVSELMIENFYQPLIDWARKNHLQARVQAHGSPTDNLLVYGHSDIPETEDLYAEGDYDFLKMAPSAGHLYGRKIVSSESFVWMNHDYETTPEKMKRYGDELLTAGINEIIYHGFPYEYMDRPDPGWHPFSSQYVPSMTFSSHLNFHNPFWRYLRPLNDYLSRIQYLSQTGHFAAPIALYTHLDDFPNSTPTDADYPLEYSLMANGYNFDFINQDILLNHARVIDHELQTPGGSFKALVFRNEQRLALPLAKKLHEFSQQGLPVVFAEAPPSEEIGFHNYVENGRTIRELVAGMLGGAPTEILAGSAERKNGSAMFVKDATRVPSLLMQALSVHPNLRFASPQPNIFFAQFDHGPVRFFFLRNPKPVSQDFRVALPGRGLTPEVWDAWAGKIAAAPQYVRTENEVQLDVHLDPYGSILLAVREAPEALHVQQLDFDQVRSLDGRLVAFAARPGQYRATLSNGKTVQASISGDELPATLTLGPNWFMKAVGKDKDGKEYTREYHLADLKDWTLEPVLRTFSGQGHYTLDFDLKPEYLRPGLELALDLGEVHDVAEVLINQQKVETLLLRPYRVDVTASLHAGTNRLEVIVQNTLRNRLVGDGLAGDPNFVVFKNRMFYVPSGMMGPVRLIPNRSVELR
jgi:hypothetical protein